MSFRLKTILGTAIIEAVLLFVLILSSLTLLKSSNENELRTRAYTTAQLFATTTQGAILSTDLASLDSFVGAVLSNPGIVYARVLGKHGVVLARGGDTKALNLAFKPDTRYEDVDNGIYNAYADVTVDGVKYGRVEIGFSVSDIKKVLADARNRTITLAIIEMVLVAIFSFVLGLYLTRGLAQLKEASQRIAEGELGYQVAITGKDELADAAKSFNTMSQKLLKLSGERRQAQEAVNKLNEDLERRVKLRTDELAVANIELEYQALHDSLTNLPNRTLMHDRLEQAILIGQRENRPLAVMMIDLDRFKEINDTMGHHSGDLVLREVADRLRLALRQSDTIARLGGDEFALLLPTVKDHASAVQTAQKVLSAIENPMLIDGTTLDIGASIGIALYPQDSVDGGLLMGRADMAMYAAKRGKTGYAIYTTDLDESSVDRLMLQSELRHAIQQDQLVLYYQPKIDFKTSHVHGVEALVRWQHPKHGLMFPDDFIPLAEQTGLIKPLTYWVLKEALRQRDQWYETGLDLNMAINISAANLQDPEFPLQVETLLQQAQTPAAKLEFEVTETAIMLEPNRAINALTQLADLGIQISIDDFGTGYSSMAYLKKLPVAKIKIDKSFVMDMNANNNDTVIVRSIIGLGHNLGLNVIAEGVEDQQAWDQLKILGCDSAQGYCMSRPLSAENLKEWLMQSPWGLITSQVALEKSNVQLKEIGEDNK